MLLASWYYKGTVREAESVAREAQLEASRKAAAAVAAQEAGRQARAALEQQVAETRIAEARREELIRVLTEGLHDQYSAQISNLRLSRGEGGDALCGEINAKDGSGKYFGRRPFAVTDTRMEKAEGRVIGIPVRGKPFSEDSVAELIRLAGC